MLSRPTVLLCQRPGPYSIARLAQLGDYRARRFKQNSRAFGTLSAFFFSNTLVQNEGHSRLADWICEKNMANGHEKTNSSLKVSLRIDSVHPEFIGP